MADMTERDRTVRVFTSSTFRDIHAERDHLVRLVLADLANRRPGAPTPT